jgi:transketolase
MRAIPNLVVILPSDNAQTREVTRFLAEYEGPAYMRIGRSPVPDIYNRSSSPFTFGKANILRDGQDCTIISTGEAVYHALKAAELLLQWNIHVRVLDMPTVKPMDVDAVLDAALDTNAIVTVEEHSVHGGLGSAVAEIVVQHHPVPMKVVAFPDEFMPAGSSPELFEYYGLTAPKIAATVLEFLRPRNSARV